MHLFSAVKLNQLFQSGELSARAIAEAVLKRIAHLDPKTGAFLAVFEQRLMQKASQLDEKRKKKQPLGKLAAIPIAIKDNIHIKGELTTCASKFLSNYRAPFDASVVRFLEEQDALLIGKTNMDEFAMGSSGQHSAFHATKNPWNLACSPGGSSSGSAASVAARLCPISLGSDTGGSIRQPAAMSGIVGFKPTYGRVSRFGLVAFGSSLDQIGPFATNVKDAALIMEIIGRHCACDSTSVNHPSEPFVSHIEKPIQGSKIGIPWSFIDDLSGEMRENFLQSIEVFKQLGCTLVEVDLDILKYSTPTYYILSSAEASTNLARFDGIRFGNRSKRANTLDEVYDFSRQEGFGPEVKRRILLGTFVLSSGYQEAFYNKAQKVRTLIIERLREAFQQCQVIAMPITPTPAFALGALHDPLEEYLQDLYTIGANLAGVPAINVPSGFSQEKKPIGLQLMGPQMHDGDVLKFAHAFQKVTRFHEAIPPQFQGENR